MNKKNSGAPLCADNIKRATPADTAIYLFDTIDSTNNEAKRMLEAGFRGRAVIAANTQTQGRGRLGRNFYSPPDTGLYFTIILPHTIAYDDISLITPAAAVAVTRVLRKFTEEKLFIKWVNDIYLSDRKICGILAESVLDIENGGFSGFAVGIGINLSTEDFPEDISGIAASLGAYADRSDIAAEIARELFCFADDLEAREFLSEYRALSYVMGKPIYIIHNGEKTDAHAIGIDDLGGLIVQLEDGTKTVLRGGEISVRVK